MKAMLEVRRSLRTWLDQVSAGETVLIGCSGGADSMALAYALWQEAQPRSIRAIPLVIDHGIQESSADVAQAVSERLQAIGYPRVEVLRVEVDGVGGMEASARRARFEAFANSLEERGARFLFLGHTRDDQAETVLLGLARGSGTRSLAGMAEENGSFIRPMLGLAREQTLAACAEADLEVWDDPHNHDPQYARVRVRRHLLPILEAELGPGIASALARSAKILREDADALDHWANEVASGMNLASLEVAQLAALPKAVRVRVLRQAIYTAGAPLGSLTAEHLAPVEALVTAWKGQGATSLPGGVKVERISGRLSLLHRQDHVAPVDPRIGTDEGAS